MNQEPSKERKCCQMCRQVFASGLVHCNSIADCPCHSSLPEHKEEKKVNQWTKQNNGCICFCHSDPKKADKYMCIKNCCKNSLIPLKFHLWEEEVKSEFDMWYRQKKEMNPYIMRDWFMNKIRFLLSSTEERVRGEIKEKIDRMKQELLHGEELLPYQIKNQEPSGLEKYTKGKLDFASDLLASLNSEKK